MHGYEATRRTWIGGRLTGTYGQFAYTPFQNTVIRLTLAETTYDRGIPANFTLTAASNANDARNGQFLRYLLASNRISMPAQRDRAAAGVIANGKLTWDNVDPLMGWRKTLTALVQRGDISVETRWTGWLSTQLSAGILEFRNTNHSPG